MEAVLWYRRKSVLTVINIIAIFLLSISLLRDIPLGEYVWASVELMALVVSVSWLWKEWIGAPPAPPD